MTEEKKIQTENDTSVIQKVEEKITCGKTGCHMDKLKKAWGSEKKETKIYVGLALVVFIASFLPWSASYGYLSYSLTAWVGTGYISILASIAIILLWALPIFGVKIPKIFSSKEQGKKILSSAILASPVIWFLQAFPHMRSLGIGLWITLVIGGYLVFISFKK
jgi:hypothetical protein